MWRDKPTINLDEEFRAHSIRKKLLVEDFWKEAAIELLADDVEELKRWRRNLDAAGDDRQAA